MWAYSHLVPMTDMPMVSAIEHPRLPRDYFSVLVRAIERAEVFDNVATCDLGPLYIPDLVPETADRLVAAEGIRWAIVVGQYEDEMYASLRVNDRRYSAGKLVREAVERYPHGSAGGHGSMAGARIPFTVASARSRTRVRRKFLRELALATGISQTIPAERFAPRPEDLIVERAKNGRGTKPIKVVEPAGEPRPKNGKQPAARE